MMIPHRHHQSSSGSPSPENSLDWWSIYEWDVLCGRSVKSASHPGNRRFRSIIQSFCGRYQASQLRSEKNRIINEVTSIVHQDGGRFLRQEQGRASNDSTYWVPLEKSQVYEKVSHALRSTKIKMTNIAGEAEREEMVPSNEDREVEGAFKEVYKMQQEFYQGLQEKNLRNISRMQGLLYQNLLEKMFTAPPSIAAVATGDHESGLMWVAPAEKSGRVTEKEDASSCEPASKDEGFDDVAASLYVVSRCASPTGG